VTYLGADVPFDDLEGTLAERRPAMLCTSVIFPLSRTECVEVAKRLRKLSPARTGVVLGGAGIPEALAGSPVRGVSVIRSLAEANGFFSPNGNHH
jgi:methanogenic corrinoid protein MtbC1